MSILSRLFPGPGDPKNGLIRDLEQLPIDWASFRDRAMSTLRLLGVTVPCAQFRSTPSARTLVDTADALLTTDPTAAMEFRQLLSLASLESLIMGLMKDALHHQSPYLLFSVALQKSVLQFLDRLPDRGSRFPPSKWVAAYLSVSAGQNEILSLDRACKNIALQFAARYDPAVRDLRGRI